MQFITKARNFERNSVGRFKLFPKHHSANKSFIWQHWKARTKNKQPNRAHRESWKIPISYNWKTIPTPQ
ncbi:unnamed protein product [Blepharisma stoltei]|uniref:Uncharacterized protein n=1 Tax=Blepharisma stoltei TaxID=1481888 RepID=A0AAU9K809_9CILI|nr:unnamed protein product [Blepharisma stoltei]